MNSYKTLVSMKGHMLCAVDIETTGLHLGHHELYQIAIVPLDHEFQIIGKEFSTYIRPEYTDRHDDKWFKANGISFSSIMETAPTGERVQERLVEWWESHGFPSDKRIMPLAHNWPFDSSFLRLWLGGSLFEAMFHGHSRDTMSVAAHKNDLAAWQGKGQPFTSLSLKAVCKTLGVVNTKEHDALSDAVATAECYHRLLSYEV